MTTVLAVGRGLVSRLLVTNGSVLMRPQFRTTAVNDRFHSFELRINLLDTRNIKAPDVPIRSPVKFLRLGYRWLSQRGISVLQALLGLCTLSQPAPGL